MNKKLLTKIIVLCLSVSMIVPNIEAFASKNDNSYVDSKDTQDIDLSDYDYEVSFTSREEIEVLAEEYDLEDADKIEEIIYVPIEKDLVEENDNEVATVDIGAEEYYIKKKGSEEKQGTLLRSSWYEAPGGSMSISESITASVNFANSASVEGGSKTIKATLQTTYGFSLSKSITISDTQNVTVKKGYKRNVKAYVNNMVYSFELWEDDVFSDDLIGKGTIKRPIGVIFTIGSQVKK